METEREQVEEMAAHWVARETGGFRPRRNSRLLAWLDAEAAHRLAYLRLKSGWQRTERLAAFKVSPQFPEDSADRRRKAWFMAVAAAAVLALAGMGLWQHFVRRRRSPTRPNAASVPSCACSDGTRIQLNTDTQVQTNVTQLVRTVTLERGEAYFDGRARCQAAVRGHRG